MEIYEYIHLAEFTAQPECIWGGHTTTHSQPLFISCSVETENLQSRPHFSPNITAEYFFLHVPLSGCLLMTSRGTSPSWRCVTWPLTPCRGMNGSAGPCQSMRVGGWEAALLAAAGTPHVGLVFLNISFYRTDADWMLDVPRGPDWLFVLHRNILDEPSVSAATVRGGWRPRGRAGGLYGCRGADAERPEDAAPSRGEVPHHRIFNLRGTDHMNPKSWTKLMFI